MKPYSKRMQQFSDFRLQDLFKCSRAFILYFVAAFYCMTSPFVVSPELDEGSNHERENALRQAQGERAEFYF
jgi:hypothetical protein